MSIHPPLPVVRPSLLVLAAAASLLAAGAAGAAGEKKAGSPAAETVASEPPPPPPVTFTPSVQERARFELLPDKTFSGDAIGSWQIGNRARLGVEARFGDVAGVFVQIQDVRTWGSEYNAASLGEGTLTDSVANGLDVHQAYGQLDAAGGAVHLRVGRQEISWHGQRLIGAVGWTHQARSFDAVRLWGEPGKVGFGALYAPLLNRPVSEDDTANRWQDAHLIALRAGPRLGEALDLDALAIIRIDAATDLGHVTFGAHGKGAIRAFSWELEGYGQVGSDAGMDYLAAMVGARAGVTLGGGPRPYLGGGVDLLSGDPDPTDGTARTFDTLYATNHKFYGHLDAYLAIPVHTRGEGLIDGMINTRWTLSQKVKLRADAHVFASAAAQGEAFHGVEVDVDGSWSPVKPLTVSAGLWLYAPGAFWNDDPRPEIGAYLATDFRL